MRIQRNPEEMEPNCHEEVLERLRRQIKRLRTVNRASGVQKTKTIRRKRKGRTEGEYKVDCAICMESVTRDEGIALECDPNHMYHQECIEHWLEKSNLCPLCRQKIRYAS